MLRAAVACQPVGQRRGGGEDSVEMSDRFVVVSHPIRQRSGRGRGPRCSSRAGADGRLVWHASERTYAEGGESVAHSRSKSRDVDTLQTWVGELSSDTDLHNRSLKMDSKWTLLAAARRALQNRLCAWGL